MAHVPEVPWIMKSFHEVLTKAKTSHTSVVSLLENIWSLLGPKLDGTHKDELCYKHLDYLWGIYRNHTMHADLQEQAQIQGPGFGPESTQNPKMKVSSLKVWGPELEKALPQKWRTSAENSVLLIKLGRPLYPWHCGQLCCDRQAWFWLAFPTV